jgi:hypothetical protein
MQLYLQKYGQHVRSISLRGAAADDDDIPTFTICQLPPDLPKLSSLQFDNLKLQMQPGSGSEAVVRAGLPLKQLDLNHCVLLDGEEGLAAALSLLPELEHLSIKHTLSHSMWHRGSKTLWALLAACCSRCSS